MKSNTIFCLFIWALLCGCSNQDADSPAKKAQRFLLFSQSSLNIVNAPITIREIALIDKGSNQEYTILNNTQLNLATLPKVPLLFSTLPDFSAEAYDAIKISLDFDEASKLSFYHANFDSLIQRPLHYFDGAELGKEKTGVTFTIPVKPIENASEYTALHLHWNLSSMFDIHVSSDNVIVELKPGLAATWVTSDTNITLAGSITSKLPKRLSLNTPKSEDVSILTNNLPSLSVSPTDFLHGQGILKFTTGFPQVLLLNGKSYSKQSAIIQGAVIEANNDMVHLLANPYSNFDYYLTSRRPLSFQNTDQSTPMVRSQVLFDLTLETPLLKGSLKQQGKLHYLGIEILTEEKEENDNRLVAELFIVDDQTLPTPIPVSFEGDIALDKLGMYYVYGKLLNHCHDESTQCTIEILAIEQEPSLTKQLQWTRYWWDYTYIKELYQNDAYYTKDEQELNIAYIADSSVITNRDQRKLIFTGHLPALINDDVDWNHCCRSLTFKQHPLVEDKPLYSVDLLSIPSETDADIPDSEVLYFYDQQTFAAWLSSLGREIHLETLVFFGENLPDKDSCAFEAETVHLRFSDDPGTRQGFEKLFVGSDFTITNKGLSTAAFAAAWGAIGAGALAAMGGVALLVKKIRTDKSDRIAKGLSAELPLLTEFSDFKKAAEQFKKAERMPSSVNPNTQPTKRALEWFKKPRR